MRILKLKLRGAIGIKKGLGLDEVEIDFTKFGPGLIALTGKNGSGKTSILEQLHPFRQMVSRDGSLQSHFFLKDSYRILAFELNGEIYESKILIDALTGGSEAYLIQRQAYGEQQFPLNDGKLTTYDIEIEKLLGTPELFFNSVFSGQKSKGIAELKPADRRKLFYELLNLNSYEVYLEHAKKELRDQEFKLAKVEGELSAIGIENCELRIEQLEAEKTGILKRHEELTEEIGGLEVEISTFEENIKEFDIEIRTSEEKLKGNEEIEKRITAISDEIQTGAKELNSKVMRYNSEIEDNQKLIERNKNLASRKDEISSMIASRDEAKEKISTLQQEKNSYQTRLNKLQEDYSADLQALNAQEKNLNTLRNELQKLELEAEQHEKNLSRMKKDTEIIDVVPCNEATGKSCGFLINAYETKSELAELLAENYDYDSLFEVKERSIKKAEDTYEHDKNMYSEKYYVNSKELKDGLKLVDSNIEQFQKVIEANGNGDLDKMFKDSLEAENNIKLLEQKIDSIRALVNEAVKNLNKEIERLKSEARDLQKKLDLELPKKITQLKEDLATENLQLQSTRTKKNIRTGLVDELKQEFAKVHQEIEAVKQSKERIAILEEEKKKIESEIRDWTFLFKAFDKTGIPVLKLENSGIEITTIANELLSLFENKFRIVFETTKLKADKKNIKETFDINIVEEDGVVELANKSGGERVWIETALRLAVSLVVRQQGKNIQTSFADEVDGALDLNNAHIFLQMLINAHNKSGVHNTFFITHRPELLDLIPQQISLSDGYLRLVMN